MIEMKQRFTCFIPTMILLVCIIAAKGQNTYLPKGDPGKWNVELTPFLWLPAIGGDVGSVRLSEDYNIPSVDLLSNLKMAFMINGEVSKGKFFAAPYYVYTKLGTEETKWTSGNGAYNITAKPDLKLNILGLNAGGRFRANDLLIFDAFAGFRYTSYQIVGSIEGINQAIPLDEKADFWDPVVGFQMYYYPIPRVPVILKVDVGGFGAGSDLSWTTELNSGYTVSPSFDLLAGFSAYGTNFEKENALGNKIGLNMIMYGFDIGLRYHIPKRVKDPAVFKKVK